MTCQHRHDELNVDNHSHDDSQIQPELIYKEKMADLEGSLNIDNKLDATGCNAAIIGSAKKIDNLAEEPACLVIHANKGTLGLYLNKFRMIC